MTSQGSQKFPIFICVSDDMQHVYVTFKTHAVMDLEMNLNVRLALEKIYH
jgi:hypothetical protein